MTKPAGPARFDAPRTLRSAALLFVVPVDTLRNISQDEPLRLPTLRILFWGLLAGALDALTTLLGWRDGSTGLAENLLTVAMGPPFFLLFAAVMTPLYHLLARAAGGLGSIRVSYRIAAALMPLVTLDILLGGIRLLRLGLLVFKLYLAALAAEHVHAALPRRVWWVFGPLLALFLAINLF